MPTDEHDEREAQPTPEPQGGDAPAPPAEESLGVRASRRRRGWRRVVNRRNAMWTGLVAVVAVVALALIIFVLYRTGRIDRIIADQIVSTLAKYNVRAEIGHFETKFNARTVEMRAALLS